MVKFRSPAWIAASLACALVCLGGQARAGGRIYRYTRPDGTLVITNVPQGKDRSATFTSSVGAARTLEKRPLDRRTRDQKKQARDYKPDLNAYDEWIEEAALRYRVPFPLVKAVIATESYFNPLAVSHAGAEGLMQLMPGTAAEMGVEDSFDAYQNIMGGSRYLREMANKFNGDMILLLAAYNAGHAQVTRAGHRVPNIEETREYVRRVLTFYIRFKNERLRQDPDAPNAPPADPQTIQRVLMAHPGWDGR
ncbi:MAG: Membrane-bound lytic murein transglycosylase F [Myxococcota bacterium]|nr:Membrane-bound lytic murein transglycosylase F [Myxococcota bacterium]